MSFRTPWKAPVKAGTPAAAKIPNPQKPGPACSKPPIIQDFVAKEGDLMCPGTGPSSPEGSKCTADFEDSQLPNSSECLTDTQGSNCSQISKISCSMELSSATKPSERLKDPEVFDSEHDDGSVAFTNPDQSTEQNLKNSKSSAESGQKCSELSCVSKDGKSQSSEDSTGAGNNGKSPENKDDDNNKGSPDKAGKNNSQARGSQLSNSLKTSQGSRKPKRKKNSKDSTKNKRSRGRKCVKRPRTSVESGKISGVSSLEDSPSSAEDIPLRKAFKSSYSKNCKDSKRVKISNKKSCEPDGSESSSLEWTSSSQEESMRSSQAQSQATSLGSQFLKQEAPLILSPPPAGLDARARLAWIQQRRITGVWVYCDNPGCDKQRYLADVYDPATLPEKWFCRMNKDPERNTCEAAEVGPGIAEEEDMIISAYTAGSLVWARLEGFPEWPAMVDDDPDYDQYYWCSGYSDIPKEYHVTFFDSAAVSRAWLNPKQLRRFTEKEAAMKFSASCQASLSRRLKASHEQAVQALSLTPLERLRKFSFITRYEGTIGGVGKRTPPTPRRFLDKKKDGKKKPRRSGNPLDYGRPSQKNNLREKRRSQTKKRNKKSAHDKSGCDSSEDDENPFAFDVSSASSDDGLPPSKRSNLGKSSKASSQGSSKVTKTFKPNFKSPVPTSQKSNLVKSPSCQSVLVKPILAKSPTSTYNTTSQESTQRTRKLWKDLDSSSESEDECKPTAAPQLPASNAGRSDGQVMVEEEPASEDSIFAFAGSVCSSVHGVQPARKPLDLLLPESMDSDFIENTPTDLPKITLPLEAAASPVLGAKLPKSLDIGDVLPPASEDDDLMNMG